MKDLSTQDWTTFLKARILQEQGDDQKALEIFDQLLTTYPDNGHVKSSRAFALERLGKNDLALADRIAIKYAELGQSLTGANDKPETWTAELNSILGNIDAKGIDKNLPSALIAW